jgi:flagellar biosynthetic protein FliR
METSLLLLETSQALLWSGFVVFLRVGAIMMVLPGFGEQSVPVRVKLGLGIAFTMIVVPAAPPTTLSDYTLPTIAWLGITESIAGLALGIGIRMLVFALQTAGSMAAQATSLAQIFGGAGVEPLPAIGHTLMVSGLALAMMTGLHVRAAQLIILSYDLMPMGQLIDASSLSRWGITQVSQAFSLAFTLAAPFVVLSVLYNLTLGVINRAMPQLMVAFVGAPVITAGSLFMLFLVSPLLLSIWIEALNGFLANPLGPRP